VPTPCWTSSFMVSKTEHHGSMLTASGAGASISTTGGVTSGVDVKVKESSGPPDMVPRIVPSRFVAVPCGSTKRCLRPGTKGPFGLMLRTCRSLVTVMSTSRSWFGPVPPMASSRPKSISSTFSAAAWIASGKTYVNHGGTSRSPAPKKLM
jgi:hypothetical protein